MKAVFPAIGILLALVSVPLLPALASNSDDASPSCNPITGNPFQEKCGETDTHSTPSGDVICAPEDTETHTPNFCTKRVP